MYRDSGPYRSTPIGASLSGAPVTIGIVAINVIVFLLLTATGGSQDSVNLYRWGAKYGPAIADGEWWRLVIPMFMHIGVFHLLTNSIGLLIFGSMAEQFLGSRTYLVIYLLTGLLGNVLSYVVSPNLGAGASGAVFGVIGAFAVYLLLNRRVMGEMANQVLLMVVIIVALNLFDGFRTTQVDNWAHIGGLVSGGFLSYLVSPRQQQVVISNVLDFSPPRMGVRLQRQGAVMLGLAIAVGLSITVIGTAIRSQDYPYRDSFVLCDYHFADFSDPEDPRPLECRVLES